MVSSVNFQRLRQVAGYGRLDKLVHERIVSMDAADQQGCLSMLVLHVRFNTTSNQELNYMFLVSAASYVQRCRQM